MKVMRLKICSWCCAGLLLLAASGCAVMKPREPILAGDQVALEYACYLPDGGLAIASDPEKAADIDHKADIWRPLIEPGAALVTAGDKQIARIHTLTSPADFKQAVEAYLAEGVVGHAYDRHLKLQIKGELQKKISDQERYLRLKRNMDMERNVWMDKSAVEARNGRDPVVGDQFPIREFPGLSMEIMDAKGDQVLARMDFPEGNTVKDYFGSKRFFHTDDKTYRTVIDPQLNLLVRSGPVLGRISKIEERIFTVDYGDPLGGATFTCEVVPSHIN